jgi:rhomboid protease GluP
MRLQGTACRRRLASVAGDGLGAARTGPARTFATMPTVIEKGLIWARSKREAEDWSLALVSQGIESTLLQDPARGWLLVVAPERIVEAESILAIYRRENRRWVWRGPIRSSTVIFHWGALGWCFLVAFIEVWSRAGGEAVREAGLMQNAAVEAGEWWRLFTATTLHADLGHLMGNLCFGGILLGLAMARWGAGGALLAIWCAGALGNVAAFWVYDLGHRGLGASGMVMGALGLLAAAPWQRQAGDPIPWRDIIRGVVGGVMLFVLLGLNPASDTVAHLGGFVGGLVLGLIMAQVPQPVLLQGRVSLACGTAVALMLVWVWSLALS